MICTHPLLPEIESIARKLDAIGRKTYIVGSFCVNALLRKPFSGDIDLTTDARPEEVLEVLQVRGEIGKKYGTFLVEEGKFRGEITSFRRDIGSVNFRRPVHVEFTDSLEEDALRRDFTFNAIYYDVLQNFFIDPTGGKEDLNLGVIRFVGSISNRLDEDLLRILRYVRLKNKYHLQPAETDYADILRSRMPELRYIAQERIKQELDRMLFDHFNHSNTNALRDLKDLGYFRHFIPEIDRLSDTPWGPGYHLEGDVWTHTLMCLESLNTLDCQNLDTYWAMLLHDIGKPDTVSFKEGIVHYYEHQVVGAELFRNRVAHELKFSEKSSRKIEWMIANHLRAGIIPQVHRLKAYKLMMHEYFPDLLLLAKADNMGKIPSEWIDTWKETEELYVHLMDALPSAPFLTGEDIMRQFPDIRGAEIGKRLQEANDCILGQL